MYEGMNIYTSLEDEGETEKGFGNADSNLEKSDGEEVDQSHNSEKKPAQKPSLNLFG